MGVRPAAELGPFWYVDDPTTVFGGASLEAARSIAAQDDILFCGKRVDLTVQAIQAVEGPRMPAIGDEVDTDASGNPAPDVKTMAFLLLIDRDSPEAEAHAAAIDQVDTFRRTWERYANGPATGGRGRFDTSLRPAIH